jgi:hypothetical protein
MNDIFSTEFIEESGKLKKKNWGLAEMRISAGYLNHITYQDIGFHKVVDEAAFVKAIPKMDNGTERLAYQFTVPKPKDLLIIGDPTLTDLKKEDKDILKKFSIYAEEKIDNQPYEHEIVVIFKDALKEKPGNIEGLPGRIIIVGAGKDSNDIIDTISRELKITKNTIERKIVILEKEKYESLKGDLSQEKKIKDFKVNLYKEWVENLINKPESFYLNLEGIDKSTMSAYLVEKLYGIIKEHVIKTDHCLEKECLIKDEGKREHIKNKFSNMSPAEIKNFIDDPTGEVCEDTGKNVSIRRILTGKLSILKDLIFRDEDNVNIIPKELRTPGNDKSDGINNWINDFGQLFSKSNSQLKMVNKDPEKSSTICYGRHIQLSDFKNYAPPLYLESLSGSQFYFTMLYDSLTSNADPYRNKKIILQMIENALLRYVIVDERAARYVVSSETLGQKFKFLKIKVPLVVKFSEKKTISLVEGLKKKTKLFTEHDLDGCDIFIIHQGVLDKMGLNDKDKASEFLGEIKKSVPFVFVTSGRGKPDNVPGNVKFLPFSTVDSFLLKEYPEKLLLTQSVLKLNLPKNGDSQ